MTPQLEKELQELYPPDKFPPSARALIRKKFALFEKTKNPHVVEELENLGFTADFSREDVMWVDEDSFK